ncbi:hypothetical protein PIB30_079406 [Stylosanthes scabra]|uniref:Uncharacterized protein n=1 Tax=Stylosanthes scabra TaxID=79078 RepID=A0ABU6TSI1_9FABA|nr:hypothetical protein [Stylosanthes scabra]
MCRMGADGVSSVAVVPVGGQSGGPMALALSGRTDRRAAAGGANSVPHSDKAVAGATVCDSGTGAGNAAELIKATDNPVTVTAGRTAGNRARAADTAAVVKAEGTTTAVAWSEPPREL